MEQDYITPSKRPLLDVHSGFEPNNFLASSINKITPVKITEVKVLMAPGTGFEPAT